MHFLQNGFDSQLNIYIEIKTYFLETYVVHGTVKYRDNPVALSVFTNTAAPLSEINNQSMVPITTTNI